MAQQETLDKMIRLTLRTEVRSEEPSSAVREALLAAAAGDNTLRSTLGPTIPPLVNDLQEVREPVEEWSTQITTAIPLGRRQLLLLAAPLYAVR
ncbi:MAG TPA: hypothetical protein VMP08_10925 [Anaerolineae bacterium]|nr:hypothetical protein [Anaerolineae bacterium]